MTVHRGRGLSSKGHSGKAVRNALIGAGVSAAFLWWLTKPSTALATAAVLPTPYFPPPTPQWRAMQARRAALQGVGGTTDCSSYMPASIDPSDNTAPGQLAAFGACSGQNALVQGIIDSSIVQSIENAIETGTIESAQLVGIATIATQVVGAVTGVSVAAATSVMPIVGLVLTAVIAIATWINGLGGGPQIFVPNPQATGGDSVNYPGLGVFEKINLSDYGGFVQNAMNWVNANPQQALGMSPQQLSNQFAIFLTSQTPAQLASTNLQILANPLGPNVYSQLATGNPPPPGAYEILRAVQLPAAAAICAAMPTKAGFLTNYGGTGGMGSAPLQSQFPALTTADMAAIFNEPLIHDPFEIAINNAQDYVNAQCPPAMDPTVLTAAPYSLAYQDAVQVLTQWAPVHPCSGYQAPSAQPGPQQCVTLNIPLLPGMTEPTVCFPGPPQIVAGSDMPGVNDYGGSTGGSGGVVPPLGGGPVATPASSGVARTAGIALGSAGAGLLVYHLYTGYSALSTLRSLGQDIKAGARRFGGAVKRETGKVAGAVKRDVRKLEHRRSNPLDRSSATGGRLVAYRVRLEQDIVEFEGRTAVLYRNDVAVAAFRPSPFQKTKIRSGEGEMLVFSDQLEVM